MITALSRGHKCYYDGLNWRYEDTGKLLEEHRPCKHCGKRPVNGEDACLGHIPGAIAACCGHGIRSRRYVKY